MLIWLLIIAGCVILDQASKAWVMYGLGLDEVGESLPLIENVFHFTHVRNTGAAFGMLGGDNERWIFIIISTIGIIALLVYLWKFRPQSKWACTALSMVIGGGIGNMIDRCFRVGIVRGEERHYVFDFLDFCAFPKLWKWTFNVADAFVCVGAGILMVWCVGSFIIEARKEAEFKRRMATILSHERVYNPKSASENTEDSANDSESTEDNEDIENIEKNENNEN